MIDERYDQLPMLPYYHANGTDYLLLREAAQALGVVTANPGHGLIRRPDEKRNHATYEVVGRQIVKEAYRRPSLLAEVEGRMPAPSDRVKALFPRTYGNAAIPDMRQHAAKCASAVKTHIARSWDPAARHVVMHSSGFDTRIVCAALKELASERGADWLGEVRFVSFEPEIKESRRIFDHLGWAPKTWAPIDSGKTVDYYADCLDFRTAGAHFSEAERFWGGPLLSELRLEGYLTSSQPLQGLTALWADETTKWNRLKWGTVGWFLACYFFDNPGVFPGRPEISWVMPFASYEWVDRLSTVALPEFGAYPAHIQKLVLRDHTAPSGIDAHKLLILDHMDPELARLPNWRFQAGKVRERNRTTAQPRGVLEQQKISAATAEKMEADYRKSWYAKTFGPATLNYQADRTFSYWGDRNVHYLKAAIYESLLRAGVQISK